MGGGEVEAKTAWWWQIRDAVRLVRLCWRALPALASPVHAPAHSRPSDAPLPFLLDRSLHLWSNGITHMSDQALAGLSSLTYDAAPCPAIVVVVWCAEALDVVAC